MKRGLDIFVSLSSLVLLSPVLVAVFASIRLKLGNPALFRQRRPGLEGRIFTIYKFRTMTDERGADGDLLPDEKRLTAFGKTIRSLSLDELPQLWNVLVGDMSLVGPRPLLEQYLSRYSPRQARRHDVRPGITGWAQVNGRNATDWPERLEMDVWYVENRSFWLDLKIIARSIIAIVRRDGVTSSGHASMPEFLGNGVRNDQSESQLQDYSSNFKHRH